MYSESHVYDLSFVAPEKSTKTRPQIIFTIDRRRVEEVRRRLLRTVADVDIELHFDEPAEFSYFAKDLFGRVAFGFGRCAYTTERDDSIDICFEIGKCQRAKECALSIHLLTQALLAPFDDGASNRAQQADLVTSCDPLLGMHGHSMGGYVSRGMIDWLQRQAAGAQEHGVVEIPKTVISAMREAWITVCPDDLQKYEDECRGSIASGGRFSLHCFGNACELAIYPDQLFHGGDSQEFSCHNLDSAMQQLTLLAGLAKLCELARENE